MEVRRRKKTRGNPEITAVRFSRPWDEVDDENAFGVSIGDDLDKDDE